MVAYYINFMKTIQKLVADYILNNTPALNRFGIHDVYGTAVNDNHVSIMIPLTNKQNWFRFIGVDAEYKVIIYLCDYVHTYGKIKLPDTNIPWDCIETFIEYCQKHNVNEKMINKFINIVSKGFPLTLVDKKIIYFS